VEPNSNPIEVHPQLSNNGHPVDGALVGPGSPLGSKTRSSSKTRTEHLNLELELKLLKNKRL
jgi:hypothetical protein